MRVSSATLGVETRSFGCGLDDVQRFVLSDALGACTASESELSARVRLVVTKLQMPRRRTGGLRDLVPRRPLRDFGGTGQATLNCDDKSVAIDSERAEGLIIR